MRIVIIPILLTLCICSATSQTLPREADRTAIKEMCGCFSVTFDYAETFATDYTYERRQPYHAEAEAEWIFVEEETEDKIVLQHLLDVGEGHIIKHWRQDWVFENTDQYLFTNTGEWKFNQLPAESVKGQWSQKVFQVADSPRYEGSASWSHLDGRRTWESTADAPLPRREYTKRSDYNVMQRTNRHIITEDGWIHEQDNLKIIRTADGDSVLVAEKGINRYTRIDDSYCQNARDWWEANRDFWAMVRTEWSQILERKQDLHIQGKIDDTPLWKALFTLSNDGTELSREELQSRIRETISTYLGDQSYRPEEVRLSKKTQY